MVYSSYPKLCHLAYTCHRTASPQRRQKRVEAIGPCSTLQPSRNIARQIFGLRVTKLEIPQRAILVQILEWTLHSRRPLRPCELFVALSTKRDLDKQGLTGLVSHNPFNLVNEEDLNDFCRDILAVTEDGTLSFVDKEIISYLTTVEGEVLGLRPAGKVHEMIAAVCFQEVACLSPQALLKPWISSGKVIRGELNDCHLKEYATLYWLEHFQLAGPGSRLLPFLLHHAIKNVVQSEDIAGSDLSVTEFWQRTINIGLKVCCLFDAEVLGRTYIDMGANFSSTSLGAGEAMLHVAAMNQSLEITRLLIEKGADVEGRLIVDHAMTRCTSRTPLHMATVRGHLSIIKLLVSAGADVNASTMVTGRTALQLAVESGHEEIANYLLDCGAISTMIDGELGRLGRLGRNCGPIKMMEPLSRRSLAEAESMEEASTHCSQEEQDDLEDSCVKLRDLSFHEDEVCDRDDELLQEHGTDVMLSSRRSLQLEDSNASVSLDGDSWLCIELADCGAEIFWKV
jgi:hypothetical protein